MIDKKNKGTLKSEKPQINEGQENENLKSLIEQYVKEAVQGFKESFGKDFEGRIAAEREEAAKMATMSSEERAKAEIERNRKDFETEKAQYVNERAQFEAAKELTAQNLPVTFAPFVADGDRDTMLENISIFKTEYLKAIEAGLSDRLKGSIPKVSKEREDKTDPFLSGLGF